MSGNVDSAISESGVVENVGVAVGIAPKSVSTSGFYFRFRGRRLSYRCRPMFGNVGSVIFESGMIENEGVAVEIASPSVSFQKLFPLPVPWPTF